MGKVKKHGEGDDNQHWSQDAVWVWLAVKVRKMKEKVIEGSYGGKDENKPVWIWVVDNLVEKVCG